MTSIELRTTIVAELDDMSIDMLERVSRYVMRLRRHTRNQHQQAKELNIRHEEALSFVKTLSVSGGEPVPSDERIDTVKRLSK